MNPVCDTLSTKTGAIGIDQDDIIVLINANCGPVRPQWFSEPALEALGATELISVEATLLRVDYPNAGKRKIVHLLRTGADQWTEDSLVEALNSLKPHSIAVLCKGPLALSSRDIVLTALFKCNKKPFIYHLPHK